MLFTFALLNDLSPRPPGAALQLGRRLRGVAEPGHDAGGPVLLLRGHAAGGGEAAEGGGHAARGGRPQVRGWGQLPLRGAQAGRLQWEGHGEASHVQHPAHPLGHLWGEGGKKG